MKNASKNIFLVVFCALVTVCSAQTKKYDEAMKKSLALLNSANTVQEFGKAALSFEEIALTEKKDWLSYYYAGICHALVAFGKTGKDIDTWCDKAEQNAKKADSLSKSNSEIYVLKSMIAAARIMVNQKQRAQKYGTQAGKYVAEAIKLNPNNPRCYLQKARVLLNTPDALGGGNKKAKPALEMALEKYKTFKPDSNLFPDWGKEDAEKELKKINEKLK